MGIKNRILEFAGTVESHVPFFASKIFGSETFFSSDQQVTIYHLINLAATYPALNINWIITGNGGMIYIEERRYPADEYNKSLTDPNLILVEVLEEELNKKQRRIDELELQLLRKPNT